MQAIDREQLKGRVSARIDDTVSFMKRAPGVTGLILARGLVSPDGVTELPFVLDETASLYVPTEVFYGGMMENYSHDGEVKSLIRRLWEGESIEAMPARSFSLTERAYPGLQLNFRYLQTDGGAYAKWTASRSDGYHWKTVVNSKAKGAGR